MDIPTPCVMNMRVGKVARKNNIEWRQCGSDVHVVASPKHNKFFVITSVRMNPAANSHHISHISISDI